MQDLLQLSLEDEEEAELFEGVTAGSKVKITLEVTVSEVDDERFVATVDMVEDEIDVLDEDEDEDEEDYESEGEEEYEEDEEDEDE